MQGRMAPQRPGRVPDAVRTRIAMAMGVAMARAEDELARPSAGVEAAERCGAAARAAVVALIDLTDPTSPGMPLPLAAHIAELAYLMEWRRLMALVREEWHR